MENEYLHEMYLSVAREICPYAEVGMTIRIPIRESTDFGRTRWYLGMSLRYIDYLIMPDITIAIEDGYAQALRIAFI